jgi:hypothetical protein
MLTCQLDYETCRQTSVESRKPPVEPLPELTIEVKSTSADFPDQLIITDPENSSTLTIGLWRTVRLPEDGRVYDLPAGLGTFPLVDAGPFKEKLSEIGIDDVDLVIPMYDREAMYMEFGLQKFDFSNPQRPFAIRPYVGGINAISGESLHHNSNVTSQSFVPGGSAVRTRVGKSETNEVKQDYVVADISIHDIMVYPQWLDGIAVAPGRVKQFVSIPFGSGLSIESQIRGKEVLGGIQLEIIPSLPLSHLRQPPTEDISVHIHTLTNKRFAITIDRRALVWDLLMMFVERSGGTPDLNILIYDSQPLEPLATLNYYGISNSSILTLVYKLRGGGEPPPPMHPKRMAMGAGGSISQNIKRDRQPPSIWDYRRAKLVNIQIVNSSSFEELTGIVAPASPIDFQMYQELGIPFFRYYLEDAESISGSFGNIQSVGSEAGDLANAMSNKTTDGFWSQTPDSCSKCNENTPHRL